MNDQERDLILDLVAGRLNHREADEALARVSNDPVLSAAYAEQSAIHEALANTSPAVMSTAEASDLRAALVEELNLEDQHAVARGRARKQRSWLQPAAGLAGAAAVIVVTALIVLPGSLSSSDSSETVAADSSATANTSTTAAASSELPNEGDSQFLAPTAGSDAVPETAYADGSVTVTEMPGISTKDLLEATLGQVSPPEIEDTLIAAGLHTLIDIDSVSLIDCATQATASFAGEASPLILGAERTGTSTIVYLGILGPSGIETVISVDLADCRVLDSATELDLIED
ncbi:MAG: hypothetical protein O3B42_03955 [Actinomycetota bacterium]|nr:hypothetical protein [Actinomycetota bacterium]